MAPLAVSTRRKWESRGRLIPSPVMKSRSPTWRWAIKSILKPFKEVKLFLRIRLRSLLGKAAIATPAPR